MTKQNRSIFIEWQGVILALAVVLYGLLELAYCQGPTSAEWQPRTDGTVLLLQQTPPQGGEVNPRVGIHRFDLNAEVTLTAVSKPGYYFVYWIGDVGEPTANSTIVYLDAPKIVIAVFERSEFEFEKKELQVTLGGVGGGLRRSAGDYSRSGGSFATRWEYEWPKRPEEPPTPEPDFPVPEEGEGEANFPVPELPEPATVTLLALGSLVLLRKVPLRLKRRA